jgi:hypothetical protein
MTGVYRSVYGEPRRTTFGSFISFPMKIEPYHIQNGFWRFTKEGDGGDDQRAYQRAFLSPEQVLLAALHDEGQYNNRCDGISIQWHPGQLDTFQFSRSATAKQHIEHITEERMTLGKSASFRGTVPVYPIDTEGKLLELRQKRSAGYEPQRQDFRSPELPQSNTRYWIEPTSARRTPPHVEISSGITTSLGQKAQGSGSLSSHASATNVPHQTDNLRLYPSGPQRPDVLQTLLQSQSRWRSPYSDHSLSTHGSSRTWHASSAATIPFPTGTAKHYETITNSIKAQDQHHHPQVAPHSASKETISTRHIRTYNGNEQRKEDSSRRLPPSLRTVQEDTNTMSYSSSYASPYASPDRSLHASSYPSPHCSASPHHSDNISGSTPPSSSYGAHLNPTVAAPAILSPRAVSTLSPSVDMIEIDKEAWTQHKSPVRTAPHQLDTSHSLNVPPRLATTLTGAPSSRQQSVVAPSGAHSLLQPIIEFDRPRRRPASDLPATKRQSHEVIVIDDPPVSDRCESWKESSSPKPSKPTPSEPTTAKSSVLGSTDSRVTEKVPSPKAQISVLQEHDLDAPDVNISQLVPPVSRKNNEKHAVNSTSTDSTLEQPRRKVYSKKQGLASMSGSNLRGSATKITINGSSIPTEILPNLPGYEPNDPFITDLLPLSENVPCMDCGGSEHHAYSCHIASK